MAYIKINFKNKAERVAFLFEQYQLLTSIQPPNASKPSKKKSAT